MHTQLHIRVHMYNTLLYFVAQGKFQVHPVDFMSYEQNIPAAFNCTYDNSKYSVPPTILWELNDMELSKDNPTSFTIFSYDYTSFLQIHQPLNYANAKVKCVVRSESGASVYSEEAILRVSG